MQYPLIDLLRAVAVMLVLVFHVTMLGQWSAVTEAPWALPVQQGWIGVDLFLVISGFVITLSAGRDKLRHAPNFAKHFMARRLRRVLPLYALTSVVYVFMVRPELLTRPTQELLIQIAAHTLFLQNLSPFTHGTINGVTWSLALEMQFYLALMLGIGYLLKRNAWSVLLVLVALAWTWRFGATLLLQPAGSTAHLRMVYSTQLPGTFDAFGIGMALALLTLRSQAPWARYLQPGWPQCLGWTLTACVLMSAAWVLFVPRSSYWDHTSMVVFWRTLLASGFGAAVAAAITCPLRGGGVFRPILYLGRISYGIYLWHFPVLLALLTLPGLRGSSLLLCVFTGAVLLASLSWHLMESHWIRK